ncbi:N-formylglutamate amidohydrolase [Rhizorhapis suberifaciens]|uniref:Putative N-formylglutamate amidohydrolase n=1 Tax=Rhizorhapis suberifaciens TaxID=13656 RepID=A0A840HYI0_9SPHN|nr:N-formylglutamate amidohydrolase [Rhizorhapis suberifaciens]MBB4642657.1 putative N-formylglutamate amidohydrolase [Rhizorhapis suberifaciens]
MEANSDPAPSRDESAFGYAANSGMRPLLGQVDPSPVGIVNPGGRSPFLLIGDHAGNRLPSSLATLGLSAEDLRRHIAWDIGVQSLGELLSDALDAVFLHQRYSRLVVDCNRDPESESLIPSVSDGTFIQGNQGLSEHQRLERLEAIHEPYQRAIAAELDSRRRSDQATVLISLHSFTPTLFTVARDRPWHIGVLHDRGNIKFATDLLAVLRTFEAMVVGENEPYTMPGSDYTVPRHAYPMGLPYAELEIRQDLLLERIDLLGWRDRLSTALLKAADHSGGPF